ncbi:Shikimate kinase [bioreactor metagenome]|uniref:shikimate kinase n=1 Tax=bioreactor metagenome TaxID=1076179 RepID=A0A645GJS7_9ZZZZ|nr:shikimate kinase [Clostridium sp. HMP27]KGK81763.1 shikimate kinase [Clostridium sp. HMP27]
MKKLCDNRLTKNIVIIGMPGSGKSTIGKELAKRLNMKFCDIDEYIVKKESKSIPEIFQKGEEEFRNIESIAVKEVSSKFPQVIATGGGVIKREENIKVLRQNGIIIFLNRPIEHIAQDVDIKSRPLLKDGSEKLYDLFKSRYELYDKYCDCKIVNINIEECIEKILNFIQ